MLGRRGRRRPAVARLDDRALVPGAGNGDGQYDPLAFTPDRAPELERRAAAGSSHILYAKSPGGAAESAGRTAAWRPQIETAARRAGLDPDVLEAMVFLESAGRPDVVAGTSLESAVGLTQILAETAVNLLGMKVDLPASRRFTRRIALPPPWRPGGPAPRSGPAPCRRALRSVKSLAATGRYLTIARDRFGRADLAVVSYHMGIGNLEAALRAYAEDAETPIAEIVRPEALSYARLFFDSTPLLHAEPMIALHGSATTPPPTLAGARRPGDWTRMHREDPIELARLQRLHDAKASAEEVPPQFPPTTAVFDRPEDVSWPPRARRIARRARADRCGPARLGLGRHGRSGSQARRATRVPTVRCGRRRLRSLPTSAWESRRSATKVP